MRRKRRGLLRSPSDSDGVRPVVGGLEEPHPLKPESRFCIGGVENFECGQREIFRSRRGIEHDGLVSGNGFQEVQHIEVVPVYQESVIPKIDEFAFRDSLDVGIIHHHALVGCALCLDDFSRDRDFERITMAVEMPALAFVVGNPVSGIEFQASCDQHVRLAFECAVRNYTIASNHYSR